MLVLSKTPFDINTENKDLKHNKSSNYSRINEASNINYILNEEKKKSLTELELYSEQDW